MVAWISTKRLIRSRYCLFPCVHWLINSGENIRLQHAGCAMSLPATCTALCRTPIPCSSLELCWCSCWNSPLQTPGMNYQAYELKEKKGRETFRGIRRIFKRKGGYVDELTQTMLTALHTCGYNTPLLTLQYPIHLVLNTKEFERGVYM